METTPVGVTASNLPASTVAQRILASTPMISEAQLRGLASFSVPVGGRVESEKKVLQFAVDGRTVYPAFQFDPVEGHILPVISELIERKPKGWSDLRLLAWLTRLHLDFDATPADALGLSPFDVLDAFDREIEPETHG